MNIPNNMLEFLRDQPVFTFFVVLGLGYLIGRIRIGPFAFGPVAGVLFAGIFLGQYGFSMSPAVQSIGFALFIFSVGYQAGPKFLDVIRIDGLRYFALALFVSSLGFLVAALAAGQLELPPGGAAGLLAGGMTSSPTLAAAQEAVRSGAIKPPAGWTADQLIGNIATTYAITYIFGLAGLIGVIKLLPAVLRIDLVGEAREYERAARQGVPETDLRCRGYRVTDESVCRVPAGELRARYWDGVSSMRTRRGGKVVRLEDDELLQLGDEIFLCGDLRQFLKVSGAIGEEIPLPADLALQSSTAEVVVTKRDVAGRSMADLELARRHGVTVTRLRRNGIALPITSDEKLERGDILSVVGPEEGVAALGRELGPVEQDVVETDMFIFAGGIALGVLVGLLSIKVGGVPIGLGSAGGLLASGILVGLLNNARPNLGRFPDAARWIFMEFGLLVFMMGVGLRAGADIVEAMRAAGPMLVVAGICVTLIPVLSGYAFGRKVLKIQPVLLLGALTGSMTSGASLSVVTDAAKSSVPALGYTGCYAFANVLLTIAGSLIMLV